MAVVRVATCAFLFLFTACVVVVSSFVPHNPLTYSRFQGTPLVSQKPSSGTTRRSTSSSSSSTSLRMFLGPGNDGGILGIGAPEVFTILMVGYFVLGPSDLYKVVKSVGQGISNLRQLSSDVTKTFENNMESQLQLEELRKAQRELNDAFSFRRSINVNPDTEFNTVNTNTTTTAETTTTTTEPTTSTSTTPTKRKKRKRVKKQQVESPTTSVPENLEMPTLDDTLEEERERQLLREQLETSLDDTLIREEEEREQLRRTRLERLEKAGSSSMPQQQQSSSSSSSSLTDEQERFAQQLSGNWNDYILQNEETLSPLSKIMERLAILEEEKKAADLRLEEEFRLRANVEERYYQQKRAILEEAATELQAEAYVSMTPTTTTEEETKRTV